MAGRSGKRAKAPSRCTICQKPISGTFARFGKGDDRHIECEYPTGPNGPSWTSLKIKNAVCGVSEKNPQ